MTENETPNATPETGKVFHIYAVIKNVGNTASPKCMGRLTQQDGRKQYFSIRSLAPGRSTTASIPSIFKTTNCTIKTKQHIVLIGKTQDQIPTIKFCLIYLFSGHFL